MTSVCTMALTEKTARPRAVGRCLLLPACMVRRRHAAERVMTGVALTSWNAERTDRRG